MLRKDTPKHNWGKIIDEGMGGFLTPPGHPEHYKSIKSVYEDTFHISLSSAISKDNKWLNTEVRQQARTLLKKWEKEKLPLNHKDVQEWIYQVMGYFTDCYKGETWNANGFHYNNLIIQPPPKYIIVYPSIKQEIDAPNWIIEHQNQHAGVHYIRKYYPEFKLERQHVLNAYWGSKS